MSKVLGLLFLIINTLFVAKYTIRFGQNPVITVLAYCLFMSFIWWITYHKTLTKNTYKTAFYLVTSFSIIGISVLNYYINPLNLQVDRWSAIHNFLQHLFSGQYPYAAQTHLGGYGSPFPVWQVFHIPFYLLGNVGLGMLFSICILAVFLVWFFKDYSKSAIFILLLTISPAFWYEVAVRSDLIYNFILCFISIAIIHKKGFSIQNRTIGLGVLCGLFLSTRFSIVIPFAIYLFPDFLSSQIKTKIVFITTTILVFLITFLPLVFWSFDTLFFFKYNPFILQTRQGTPFETVIIASLGLYLAKKSKKNFTRCTTYTAVTFFSLVTITFLHRMISDNFVAGLFDSAYDITYFNMALPFIIYSLANTEIQSQQR
jgi:hypothetical protein